MLKECRECGGEISSSATTCPHCGAPQYLQRFVSGFLIPLITGIIVVMIMIIAMTILHQEATRESALEGIIVGNCPCIIHKGAETIVRSVCGNCGHKGRFYKTGIIKCAVCGEWWGSVITVRSCGTMIPVDKCRIR